MTTTITAVNACDATIALDDSAGALTDITGSCVTNSVTLTSDVGHFKVFGDQWRYRLVCSQSWEIKVETLYTTTANEGLDLLRDWWFDATRYKLARSIQFSIGGDTYSAEVMLEQLDMAFPSSEAGPARCIALLKGTGAIIVTSAILLGSPLAIVIKYSADPPVHGGVYVTPYIPAAWEGVAGVAGMLNVGGTVEWYAKNDKAGGGKIPYTDDDPVHLLRDMTGDRRGAFVVTDLGTTEGRVWYTPDLLPPITQKTGDWAFSGWSEIYSYNATYGKVLYAQLCGDGTDGVYIVFGDDSVTKYRNVKVYKLSKAGALTFVCDVPHLQTIEYNMNVAAAGVAQYLFYRQWALPLTNNVYLLNVDTLATTLQGNGANNMHYPKMVDIANDSTIMTMGCRAQQDYGRCRTGLAGAYRPDNANPNDVVIVGTKYYYCARPTLTNLLIGATANQAYNTPKSFLYSVLYKQGVVADWNTYLARSPDDALTWAIVCDFGVAGGQDMVTGGSVVGAIYTYNATTGAAERAVAVNHGISGLCMSPDDGVTFYRADTENDLVKWIMVMNPLEV